MANTKLLLIEDIESLGQSGEIVTVRPGYARNFLLPQGFALVADKSALRMQARLQEERRKKALADKKESEELGAQIEGKSLTKVVKVDHEGHMYGSVSASDIVHLFQEEFGFTLEKRYILLKQALKETGAHTINVKLKEGITASFILNIVSEDNQGSAVQKSSEGEK